jgi:fatty acid desaturase
MANSILLGSTLVSCFIHLITIALFTPPIAYATFLGMALITSILNHGFTSDVFKWLDRIIMGAGTCITLYLAPTIALKIMMILVVILYAFAKSLNSNIFHICAHALITCINLLIILFFYSTRM